MGRSQWSSGIGKLITNYRLILREIVTYRFTLAVLSALRRSSNENGNPDGHNYWIKTSQDSKPHAHT
ncbi:hypothetical protein Tco_0039955 [Tanacetum coccineum]